MKQSIENFVRAKGLSSATVISAVGSLSKARMRMAGARPDAQDIRDYDEGYEIVSLIGNLGPGRSHLHMAISDAEGRVWGGHLKEHTIVHTTVELVIASEPTVKFTEATDASTGFGELQVTEL